MPELTYRPLLRLSSTGIIYAVSHSMAEYHAILGSGHLCRAKAGI